MENKNCSKKHVHFDDRIIIHYMYTWSFAFKKSRVGEWEQHGRDRVRFKERILKTEFILKPIIEKMIRKFNQLK